MRAKVFDWWIPFFGVTLCFFGHPIGGGWRVRTKKTYMPDEDAGGYTIFFLINTPYINFCVSNYLQKVNEQV